MPDHQLNTQSSGETAHGDSADSTQVSNRLISELRQGRDRGETPDPTVEQILQSQGIHLDEIEPEVLTDLVYSEWMLRFEQGEEPSRSEYLQRFPRISPQLEKQWAIDQSLAGLGEDSHMNPSLTQTVIPSSGIVPAASDSQNPDYIGKYKVICPLGAGGQADVFRALHPELGRDVVIKVMRSGWLQQSDSTPDTRNDPRIQPALAEGRLLAQLKHPHVAQVYDIDQDRGTPFLVMEYVPGQSLDQYQHTHPMSWQAAARLLANVSRAVATAHAHGIIHRDIKPQNIVVTPDGHPKLIDFGLAQLNDVWHQQQQNPGLSGTLGYMAPEQARGEVGAVGPHSDIFSLGAVLYYLLTGQPPYHGSPTLTGVSVLAILEKAKRCEWDREALASPNLPQPLVAICTRAMASNPRDRFATADQFAAALLDFAAGSTQRRMNFLVGAIVIFMASSICLFLVYSRMVRTSAAPETGNGTSSTTPRFTRGTFQMHVHQEGIAVPLTDSVPLPNGSPVSVECFIPAGFSIGLFAINGKQDIQHIMSVPKSTTARQWRYPEAEEATVPLTGPVGTECLLVIGSTESECPVDQIRKAWSTDQPWPALPRSCVLRLIDSTVTFEQRDRDLGQPTTTGFTPVDQVNRSLKQFLEVLHSQDRFIEGLAFCHIEGDSDPEPSNTSDR